ncbi:unnamed protein product [Closterium sp. Naga37s-1]|nr:unnamed protein product [Closterium sp. Naga37s-1]
MDGGIDGRLRDPRVVARRNRRPRVVARRNRRPRVVGQQERGQRGSSAGLINGPSLQARSPAFASEGFLLTASVSGAQLSSYASYLAKADVTLCIVLTSLSTFASVALTPILTSLLIGSAVPVDLLAMAKSILQVVILPVSLGLILNTYARKFVDQSRPIMPLLAIVCTSLCVGSPLAINRSQIVCLSGLLLLPPVLAFHLASFAAGFWSAKLPGMGQSDDVARTLSLCGGMQSSTLAMLLASQFLGSTHTVPASVSVVFMSIIGLSTRL